MGTLARQLSHRTRPTGVLQFPTRRWYKGNYVKAVQRMLGHAKASVTLDVYADLFDDDLDDVAANLDAAIRAAVPLRSRSL
jgi:integrase